MTERQLYLHTLETLLGVPYHWGGRDASGLDCSGLVAYALLRATGGRLDYRRWWCQVLHDRLPVVAESDAQPGDLVLYGSSPDACTHVMVLMPDGRVLGAAGGGSETRRHNARPDQCVQHRAGPRYRRDLLGFRRLPITD